MASHAYDEHLRLILENVADLIAILDKHGKRLYNSPSYRHVLGDPSALQGTDSFGEVHPEDRARLKQTFEEVIRTGAGCRSEYRFVRADGSIRYIESQSDVIKDAAGVPDKVVVVSRDITERKRAEEEIKTAYENLKAMQAELIQSEKLASIGQFAAGIVHDLKNPLGIVTTGLSLLKEMQRAGEPFGEQSAEAMALIEDSAKRATTMVHGLLSLARRDDLVLSRDDLHAVIADAVAAVRNAKVPANIQLIATPSAASASAMIHREQMQQVLINLISNAIQAMPNGGTIRVATSLSTLPQPGPAGGRRTVFLKPGDQVVHVDIADTGTGIPPEHLAKIWEPFFTTKPRGEGTGLGLAIVRSIIENHHGVIDVESTVGAGTTFRITLPLAA
ncbi:MAG: PAS domain S-box protein [Candidatus Omnitrophica bacterium]|nr:PAS domain S-box protein [Candidatus Omnitrophota bacterium]